MGNTISVSQDSNVQLPDPACVVEVSDGRGFIIEYRVQPPPPTRPKGFQTQPPFARHRLVVTAAHCLPNLPPAHAAAFTSDRTYENLLGRLDGEKNLVWAECLFADPVADIAVLGCPDNQELGDQAHAYC